MTKNGTRKSSRHYGTPIQVGHYVAADPETGEVLLVQRLSPHDAYLLLRHQDLCLKRSAQPDQRGASQRRHLEVC